MYRLILIDQDEFHAERLAMFLRRRGLVVTTTASIEQAASGLERRMLSYELVVVIASGPPEPWLAILRKLKRACTPSYLFHRPLFLFVSSRKCNPHVRLRIERLGARYVRER